MEKPRRTGYPQEPVIGLAEGETRWRAMKSFVELRSGTTHSVVIRGLDPRIHQSSQGAFFGADGLPGQVFSPDRSPTGVRRHSRHIIMHGFGKLGGQIHALARGVGCGSEEEVLSACDAGGG